MDTSLRHLTDREFITHARASARTDASLAHAMLDRFEALLDLQEELAPLIAVLDEHEIKPEDAEDLSNLIKTQRSIKQAAARITEAQGALTVAANAVDHLTED